MQAHVADHLTVPGRHVGEAERRGEILAVRGADGSPPYLVRWENGHEALVYPPPEAKIEPGRQPAQAP